MVGFIGIGSLASAQVTMSTTATGGGKTYLSIDNKAVVTNIDTLFAQLNALSSSAGSLTWGDVLDNGATATQDLDLNGKNATGANRIQGDSLHGAWGEFSDSLSVLGNATFAGELSVGDTLRAAAPALFADSVAMGGSLSVAQSIHTQGVTGASGTPLALASDTLITIIAGSLSGPFGAVAAGATGQVGIIATDEIVMDSPRVTIEELLQLTPTASYVVATPADGDIWFEAVNATEANLKIYYYGSWHTIKAINAIP